jgi:pentose-5-phosphate-3-epimerase
MSDLTTGHILGLLETTKAQRATFVADVVENLREGHANPLRVHLQVKCMEELVKALKDHPQYKAMLADEAGKYPKKFEFGNAVFEQRAGAGKWDYSGCNDHVYADALQKQAALTEQIKNHEEMLKRLPAEGIEVLADGGELKRIFPPIKSPAADVIAVTLK